MGLSSSKSKSKSTSTQNTTTTPTVPGWITDPLQNYTSKVSNYLNSDPAQFVAGASPLQERAFASAGKLGGQGASFDKAIDLATQAAIAPAATYAAPTLSEPSKVSLNGYDAPQIGNVTLDPVTEARSESLLDGFSDYLDPATAQLVDASLREYDAQSGRSAAALQAQQARSGAFGGSRSGIAQGEFAASSDRGRALTEAELRTRAFSQAAQMADADAGRRQNAGLFNAGAANVRGLTQGQYDLQRQLAQSGMDEAAARYRSDAANQGSMFNAGAENQFELVQAEFDQSAGQHNASAEEAAMQRALQAAGLIGSLGAVQGGDQRADLALAADLGEIQRAIQAAQLGAPLGQLQAAGQLYGAIPYGSYTGQQTSSSGTSTNVTKSKPSLFSQFLDAASTLASIVPKGG